MISRLKIKKKDDITPSAIFDGYYYIYCHKWFIEENCEHLKQLMAIRKSVNESNEIEIKEYSYETYYHFIQYLYIDSIETKYIDVLLEMLLLTDEYSEEELKKLCVSILKSLLKDENVCQMYSSSVINKWTDLEEYCFEFISKNRDIILKSEAFERMDAVIGRGLLTKILLGNK